MTLQLFCTVCKGAIPAPRAGRNARTCGPDCQRELNRQKAQERAGLVCRLCGRRHNKPRQQPPVLSPHTAPAGLIEGEL